MYDVSVSRLVAKEGGGEDFCQLYLKGEELIFPDELGAALVAQGLLVAPERKRRVKIPAGTPEKPLLTQTRQSRITVALDGTDPRFSYGPAKSDHPGVGVRLDRKNAAESLAGRGLDSRPKLETAKRRKTTTPLSGLPPLEPTHRLIDLKVPFETVAVALAAGPSEFKLKILTNGKGGLAYTTSVERYQTMLAQRLAAETQPSEDLLPEIPWIK